jgi:hypothetical protein
MTYSLTMKMEATYSSKTVVDFQQTSWHYIPEDRMLHTQQPLPDVRAPKPPEKANPEDDNGSDCQNVGKSSTFSVAYSRKPKL